MLSQVAAIKPAEVAGSWLTGISEVQLSSQFKLKNIEETEAAKLRLLRPDRDSEYAPPARSIGRIFGHQ